MIYILAFATFFFCSIGHAGTACESLRTLTSSGQPNFTKLATLKVECEKEFNTSSDAKVLMILRNLDLTIELESAHRLRVQEVADLLSMLKFYTAEYISGPGMAGYGNLKDAQYEKSIDNLNRMAKSALALKSKSIKDLLNSKSKSSLSQIDSLREGRLGKTAKRACDEVVARVDEFQRKSDAHVMPVLTDIQSAAKKAADLVETFRTFANFESAEEIGRKYGVMIADEVLGLQAISTWGQFSLKNRLGPTISNIDIQVKSGIVSLSQSNIFALDNLIKEFFSNLPPNLVFKIRELPDYQRVYSWFSRVKTSLNTTTAVMALARIYPHLHYHFEKIDGTAAKCSQKYPSFTGKWAKFKSEYHQLLQLKGSSRYKRYEVELLAAEALANDLSVFKQLCFEFRT